MGVTNYFLSEFKAHSMRRNPYLIQIKKPRTWDKTICGTTKKLNVIIQEKKKKHNNKIIPNDMFIPTYHYLTQPSSEKILYAVDGD